MQITVTRVDNAIYVHPSPPYLSDYLKYTRRSMEMVGYKKENVFTKYDLHRPTSDGGLVTYRGFFAKIEQLITKHGDEMIVVDQRTPLPPIDQEAVMNINYRDHQYALLVEYFDNLQKNDGIFWATGGAGKTYMQAATYAAYNKLNTILAIPLKAVVLQTHKKFVELFPDKHIGIVADGHCDISDDITITTLSSLDRCSLEKCKLFMCDEIQGATSDRMQNLVTSVNAIRNIGFTATDKNFFSKSEKVLTALFGDRLCEMDYIDAEEINAVVPGVVYFMETADLPRTYTGMDNKMKYGIKTNEERNRTIGTIAAAVPDQWQCLAFVDHVTDHLVELYKYMPSGTKFVHRETSKKKIGDFALPNKKQKDIIQDYMDNKFKHLIAKMLFELVYQWTTSAVSFSVQVGAVRWKYCKRPIVALES